MSKRLQLLKGLAAIFLFVGLSGCFEAAAQIPIITYSSPQTYTAGTTISPLIPSNSGGAAGSYGALSTFVNSNGHNAIATDASGNVYILSYNNNTLTVYNSAGTVITTNYPSTGYNGPQAAVLDALGNLYVSNYSGNTVTKTSPAGVVTTIAISSPLGLTVDASNNVYVAGSATGVIYKIAAGTAALSSFLTGFSSPWGLVINPAGDLYVSQTSDNVIYKVASGTSTHTSFATGFNSPRFLALDEKNNVYVSDVYNNAIKKITSGGAISTLISGLNTPDDEVFDPSGNIYISNYGGNNVLKAAASGYVISPALPAGLNFNKFSGVVSGTPIAASAAANYSVTATNGSGNSVPFPINITVNAMPTPAISVSGSPGCGSGTVTLTGSGGSPSGGTYNWYSSASGSIGATGSTFSPLVSGTYYLSYTTASGVTSTKSSSAITINPVVSSPYTPALFSYSFSGNANDVSGNANNGFLTGSPSLTTDRYGASNAAYNFNGSSQYISTTNSTSAPTVFTISLWFNTTVAGGKLIGFGANQTGANTTYDRNLFMGNDGKLNWGTYNTSTGPVQITSSIAYNDGKWHHVVVTVGGSGVGSTLYVDGNVQASGTAQTSSYVYTGYWRVGYDNITTAAYTNAPTNPYFSGQLDDIAVYNSVLTSTQIAASNDLNQIGALAMVCPGSPITFNAPVITGATYTWHDSSSGTQTGQNPTFPSAVSGNYTLTVTGGPGGCSSTATITPTFNPIPVISYTTPNTFTNGTAITTLSPTSSGATPVSFAVSPALPSGLSLNTTSGAISGTPTVVSAATIYTVTATSALGCAGTTSVSITVNPKAPAITYSTPQVYAVNSAITPLAPTNTGGAVGTYGAVSTPITVSNSNGIAINPSTGNIYITSVSGNAAYTYNSSNSLISTQSGSAYNYNGPAGIAVNAAGTTFVANRNAGTLVETTSGNVVTTISGFVEPTSAAIDAAGNIYVVDRNSANGNGTGKVYKIAAGTNTPVPYITGLSYPWGVAVDASGNLYISEPGLSNSINTIFKVASGSTTPVAFVSTGLTSPRDMVIDAVGNIFEADAGSGNVNEISPSGTVTTLLSGLDSPVGIALDGSGNLYITGFNFGEIYKSAAVGYTISGTLPAGLLFNNNTGVISGTPTATQVATNYTVTATNVTGSSSFVISIAVNPATPTITASGSGCDGSSVVLTASGGSPTGGTYNWYNSATGSIITTGTTFTPVVSGTYYLSYTSGGLTGALTSAAVTINPIVATPFTGASFAYPFNGNTNDITANLNNGVATGSPLLTTDRYGAANAAYNFNGSSQYVSTTNTVNNPNVFTISLWFNTTTAGGRLIGFGSSQTGASGSYDRHVYMSNSGQVYYGIYQSNTVYTINTTASYNDGNWHHVIVTQGASGSYLYVDGLLQASNSSMTTGQNFAGYWRIGYDNINGWTNTPSNYYFTGKLDDVAIYNRVLSSTEIASSNDLNLIGNYAPVCVSNPVTLSAQPITGATYSWTDGTNTVTGNPAIFPAASSGNYTLTVTGGAGSCSSTATITPGAGQTYTWTGAAGNTNAATAANWNYTTANITGQSPSFNGTENIIIPSGLSYYPVLTASESVYNLTIANGASLNLNGFTLSTACNIFNNAGGQLSSTSNNSSAINWTGTVASQNYYGSATAGTGQAGNMTVNNSSAGTVNISSGYLDLYNTLTLTKGNLAVASAAKLTLKSSATNTASVAALPTGSTVSGNVSVERYLSGGAGHRGYRLISSPVYASTVSGVNIYSINYLQNNILLTGSSGGGFDKVGNPTLYVFREDQVPSNITFTSGNFWGISAINNTPSYNYYVNGGSTTYNLPVGGGYMLFFRGDRSAASIATETVSTYVPVAVAVSTSGTLNQGQVTARDWYTPTSAFLGYSGSGTGSNTNYAVRGFNMVGNPYASSIDWNTYNTSSATTGIYASNIGGTVYELNELTYNYDTYQAGTHIATNNGSNIIASGQGFFVLGTAANPQLIFNESAKTSSQNTGASLFMSVKNKMPALNSATTAVMPHLRLQLALDSINKDDTYIGFDPDAKTTYVSDEDAPYKQGNGRVSLASISSDNLELAINKEPLPHLKGMVIPLSVNAVTDGTYQLKRTEFTGIPPLYEFWLKDAYKKDSLEISNNTLYAFDMLKADTNSFGNHRFSLVIKENPALQIHLLSFTALKAAGGATTQIAWTTENEYDYTGFTLQRSTDGGLNFTALGDVSSNSSGKYSYTDSSPLKPQDLYRLKITDLNGTVTYSDIVTVMYSNAGTLANSGIVIYPNPTNSMVNLTVIQPLAAGRVNSPSTTTVVTNPMFGIKVVSSNGLLIKSATSSSNSWKMDVSVLIPGTYVIQVINTHTNSIVGQGSFVKL